MLLKKAEISLWPGEGFTPKKAMHLKPFVLKEGLAGPKQPAGKQQPMVGRAGDRGCPRLCWRQALASRPTGLMERVQYAAGPTALNSAESGVRVRQGWLISQLGHRSETQQHPQTRRPNLALCVHTALKRRKNNSTPKFHPLQATLCEESRTGVFTRPWLIGGKQIAAASRFLPLGADSGPLREQGLPQSAKRLCAEGASPSQTRRSREDLEERRVLFRSLPDFTITPSARS